MTSTEIRLSFNELIDAFNRSWGDARKASARHIVSALKANPWLNDQIPNDVRELAHQYAETWP